MKQTKRHIIAGALAITLIAGLAALAPTNTTKPGRLSVKDVRTDKSTLIAGKCPGGRTWFMEQADSQQDLTGIKFAE